MLGTIHAVWWCFLLKLIAGAGVGLHEIILSRVSPFLPESVKPFQSYARGGVFFPDALYDCLGQHESGEEAHWPPFLAACVRHLRAKYGGVRSEDGAKFAAFLYGVLVHQVSDTSWHSLLLLHNGMIRMLAGLDFDGDYSTAHRYADPGGDMIVLDRLRRRSPDDLDWLKQDWSTCAEDLADVYYQLGWAISKQSIDYCIGRGFAGLQSELRVCGSGYPTYASKVPSLVDTLEDYYLGGISEMTSSSIECIKRLTDWINHGPPPKESKHDRLAYSLCGVFNYTFRRRNVELMGSVDTQVFIDSKLGENRGIETVEEIILDEEPSMPFITTGNPMSQFGYQMLAGFFRGPEFGPCLAVSAPFEGMGHEYGNEGSVYVIPISILEEAGSFDEARGWLAQADKITISTDNEDLFTGTRRFGESLASISVGDEMEMLAVSSPGLGRIDFFLNGTDHVMTLVDKWSDNQYGSEGRKQFGKVMLAEDIDGDGIDELIVASPLSDDLGPQSGQVFVINFKNVVENVLVHYNNQPRYKEPLVISLGDIETEWIHIPYEYLLKRHYEHFGSSLANIGNDRIAIGAEGIDRIFIYDYKTKDMVGSIKGPQSKSRFGGGLICATKDGILLIGAPLYSRDNGDGWDGISTTHAGAIFAYQGFELIATIVSSNSQRFNRFGYTGSSIELSNNTEMLIISSPLAFNGLGGVWILPLPLLDQVGDDKILQVPESIKGGGRGQVWFGQSISAMEIGKNLNIFVGMPKMDILVPDGQDRGALMGAVARIVV